MKRTKQLLILISTLAVVPAYAGGADEVAAEDRERIADLFESIDPEHIFGSPIDGWYTIRKGSVVAYISADGRYLMQGDIIDLEKQVNLTEESRSEARRELMSDVTDDDVIIFAPEEVKYVVSVFTDVECAYCRRLHSQIGDYMARGIEVRYLLYPRGGPASTSWHTSEQVWCSPDRANALTQAKLDHDFETSTCDASMVQNHYLMGQEVGLSGTPAIVLDDGELIAGYLPPDALKMRLDSKKAETTE